MKRLLAVLLVLLLVSPLALAEDGSRESEYARAVTLVEQGAYEEAATIFATIIQHQDAGLYYMYCTAFFALEIGDYPLAEESFALLAEAGFLDSDELVRYAQARALEAAGSHEEAIALYKEVLVGDSLTRVLDLQRRDAHAGGEETPAAQAADALVVAPLEDKPGAAHEAVLDYIEGTLAAEKDVNTYSFTPANDGIHRFEMLKMDTGMAVYMEIFDARGERIKYANNAKNGQGMTVEDLVAGQAYELRLSQQYGTGAYTLMIGHATPMMEISGYTSVKDSIRFEDQKNTYFFAPEVGGRYRVEIVGMQTDATVYINMVNENGERIKYANTVSNGKGLTAEPLTAGETYKIEVLYLSGLTAYQMNIGYQKPTLDITGYASVEDSMQYAEQRNNYTYTAPAAGDVKIELTNQPDGMMVGVEVYNERGESVGYGSNLSNGKAVTFAANAGETYDIRVFQNSGTGAYTMRVQ